MQNNLLLFFITWKEKYFLELLILNQFGIMNKWAKSYQTCNVAEIRKVWFRRLFLLIWQNRPIAIGFSFKSSFKKIIKSLIMTYWFQGEAIRTYKNPMISFVVSSKERRFGAWSRSDPSLFLLIFSLSQILSQNLRCPGWPPPCCLRVIKIKIF